MALIQYINSAGGTGGGTSVTVSRPTDTQEGDFMVALISLENTSDLVNSYPSGWELLFSYCPSPRSVRIYVYWKVAGASEPANYSWGLSSAAELLGQICTYRGVKQIGNYDNSTTTSSGDPEAPSINVQADNNAVIFGCMNAYGTTYTPPSGFEERNDRRSGSGSTNISACMCDDLETVAGATGTITADAADDDYFCAFALELIATRVESAGGIETGEAVGSPSILGTLLAVGAIASTLVFGEPVLSSAAQGINALDEGIVTAEAIGSAALVGTIHSAGGIESAEAIGSAGVVGIISAGGAIESAEAAGTPALEARVGLSGIAGAEEFGTAAIRSDVAASGIESSEAIGSAKVLNYPARLCGAIESEEVFGIPDLVDTMTPSGIASGEEFGDVLVYAPGATQISLAGYGIDSLEAAGSHALLALLGPLSAIDSEEAIGTALLFAGISPSSIASEEAVGDIHIGGFAISGISGISSEEAIGDATVGSKRLCGAILSAEAFGDASVVSASVPSILLGGYGVASDEAVGSPSLGGPIAPAGISSAEIFGFQWVYEENWCGNIESAEVFGTPVISGAAASTIRDISGIATAEAIGAARLRGRISTNVIATGYESGAATLVGVIAPGGIESAEAAGAPGAASIVGSSGIASEESFGDTYLVPVIPNAVTGTGRILSIEAFGTPTMVSGVQPSGIASSEEFGSHTVRIAPLVASGISSAEAFGTAKLNSTIAPASIESGEVVAYSALVWDMVWADEFILELESGLLTEIELYSNIDDEIELHSKFGGG